MNTKVARQILLTALSVVALIEVVSKEKNKMKAQKRIKTQINNK